MKIKSSVLLGFVVLVCLLGGLSLMNRMDVEQDVWRPADMYSSVGGVHNSTYSSVSYTSGASDATAVPVLSNAGSLFRHRATFSYAPAHRSPMANSQYPIGGMPSYSSKGASALYTTSSATMKSFGNGGMGAGVAMSGGSVRATSSQPATVAAVVSMPSLPTPAFSSTSSAARSSVSMEQLLASASAASYQGIGNTTAGGPMGIRGRRNAGPSVGGNVDDWIQRLINGEGWMYEDGGINYFDQSILEQLYNEAIANGDLPPGMTWEQFLDWFASQSNKYAFPIPDGVWFLCMLALGYSLCLLYRRKKQQIQVQ